MDAPLYLRQNIQTEPLVDYWYAWSHLIPPATGARNLTERHLKIMDSYISTPQIHANAAKNPKLAGGPFIDYDGKRVDEIRALRECTKQNRADLLKLSAAIAELDNFIKANAKGFSLQPLYAKIPEPLRGYVELVYDLNNNPSYRILESLLYRSKYYDKTAQSLMVSVTSGDDRPFILSTPRLQTDDALHLKLAFEDERIDQLFRLKSDPRPWSEVKELVGSTHGTDSLLKSFLTTEPPCSYSPYTGFGARRRYFGHACILLEMDNVNLMFDPVLSYTYDSNVSRYTLATYRTKSIMC